LLVSVNNGKVTAAAYVCKPFNLIYIDCARSMKRGRGYMKSHKLQALKDAR